MRKPLQSPGGWTAVKIGELKMIETIITIVIGLIGGIAVGTQAPIAGAMGQRVGGASSSLIVHLGGSVASLLLLIARGGEQIGQWRTLPWYMLCCGGFGLVLYLAISHTIPKLGAGSAITLIIVGQLMAGIVIDHLGAFDVTPRDFDLDRLVAVALLLAGAYLMVR
jgi:transporter family-2 protein